MTRISQHIRSSISTWIAVALLLPITCFSQVLKINPVAKFLALGDSYTIGQSVPATDRWPVQLADSLRKLGVTCSDPQIIATTGWTTDDLEAAIENANLKNEYSLVSLLIGVNDYYQGGTADAYGPKFENLLATAITLAQGNASNVFVISIPDYGYTPFGQSNQPTISAGINEFNATNMSITKHYGVPYFNITNISRNGLAQPDLVAADGLHPSGKQYAEWVNLILSLSVVSTDTTGTVTGIISTENMKSVYPNPFDHELTFSGIDPDADQVTLRMFNLTGELVLENEGIVRDGKIQIATEILSPGMYVYQLVEKGKKFHVGKAVKF